MELVITKRTDERLLTRMAMHYSKPRGFVGRNICYAIMYDNKYFGHIVGGSATRFLPHRNEYFGVSLENLRNIVNNIFYSIAPVDEKYPKRNFTSACVKLFMKTIVRDWELKYGDRVIGFETLVAKPRTGELYLRAGFECIGETVGYSCKRAGGIGTDSWTGKRVWETRKELLQPKIVLCCRVKDFVKV